MADWYKETEKLIASYWYLKDRIARLEAIEAAIIDSLDTLNAEIKAAKEVPSYTTKYGILPPRSRGQDKDYSDLMAQIETQVDKLSAEIAAKRKRLASIRIRLQRARETIAPIEVAMARLTEDERRITELRYVYRWSYNTMGKIVHRSEPSTRRMFHQTIYKIAIWLGKRRDSFRGYPDEPKGFPQKRKGGE